MTECYPIAVREILLDEESALAANYQVRISSRRDSERVAGWRLRVFVERVCQCVLDAPLP